MNPFSYFYLSSENHLTPPSSVGRHREPRPHRAIEKAFFPSPENIIARQKLQFKNTYLFVYSESLAMFTFEYAKNWAIVRVPTDWIHNITLKIKNQLFSSI